MKYSLLRYLLLTVIAAFALSGQAFAQHDKQIWNEVAIEHPVSDKVTLSLKTNYRLGDDVSHIVLWNLNPAVAIKVARFLTVTPAYIFQVQEYNKFPRTAEHRFLVDVTPNFEIKGFHFADRNRFEHRNINGFGSHRYRNQLRIEHPIKDVTLIQSVFASSEIVYDSRIHSFNRTRETLGAGRKFNDHFSLDVYLLYQGDSLGRPHDIFALGTSLRIKL